MRVMAVDFGTVRIGTAISDELKMFASPYKVVAASPDALRELASIALEKEVELVIIGMPYALDGSESAMTLQTKAFATKLRPLLRCPLEEWDESFSSRSAAERMRGAGMKKKKRQQKGTADTWAAAVVLQEYLDSVRGA